MEREAGTERELVLDLGEGLVPTGTDRDLSMRIGEESSVLG